MGLIKNYFLSIFSFRSASASISPSVAFSLDSKIDWFFGLALFFLSSFLNVEVWEATTLLKSLLNSIIFGVTFGLLWLSTVPPTNGIVAQIFGTKYLSSLFGIVFLSHQFGAFAGAFLGGYFYDVYGSYDYAWYMAIALSIFATVVHFPINETRLVRVDKPI